MRQEAQTLEYVLTEAEDSWRSRMLEWFPRLAAKDYPVSMTAMFEETGNKNRQVAKLVVNTPPKDVVGILEDLRKAIVAETEPMPVGILRLKAWQDGHSEDPGLTLRRTLTAPDHMVDGEKSYLRDRVRSLERQMEVFMGQAIGLNGNLAERLVGMGDLVQKLGTTRAIASTSSEMSTTALIAAAFVLPAMLPTLNQALGIRRDAPITETFKLAQAQLKVHMERSAKDWNESPGTVEQLPPRTVRELADGAPPAAAAPASTDTVVDWPAALVLVEHLGTDAAYREEVMAALLTHPPTRAILKERLPVMQALLELSPMSLKQALAQMEQAPMLRADPLPEPENPWKHLAEILGEQDVDESDPMFSMIIATFKRYVALAGDCPMRTQDRILAYCLARCVEDPPTARAMIKELQRCVDIIDPAPAAKRKLKDAAAAVEKAPEAA